jgi:hypothetical protein
VRVEIVVRVDGVVMKEQRLLRARHGGKRHCLANRRMAPADASWVFVLGVLGVMEQEVRPVGHGKPGDPVARERLELEPERGLVVGDEREGGAVSGDALAEGCAGMRDWMRLHVHPVDLPRPVRRVEICHASRQVRDLDREER